jgi:hypothetical protein
MTRYDPAGIWEADRLPTFDDEYRWVRPTLRVALQLGRWRAYAAGTWWTFRPWTFE